MKEFLENQYKNLFLWSPFVVAFGAALYFSLWFEPNFHFPLLITLLLVLIIFKYKNVIIILVALFLFGFFYSMSFTNIINTPQIHQSFGETYVYGTVKDIDFTDKNVRVLLKIPAKQINSDIPSDNYTNIRLSLNNNAQIPNINDTMLGYAKIFHPMPQYVPDSFDFARWAYFNKISGTGFFKHYKIAQLNNYRNPIRNILHESAKSNLTDALVLGYKHIIPESESNIWKSVGVGHIWSISGFHMTLVGGWLFALFYLLFRCIAPITKRIPAKYPAMFCAWVGLIFYLCISGFGVGTIRAFLMTTLIFAACIFNRNALSLRNAALVFWIILLLNPFYIMNAGFQLSFAAIFGLLWFYNDKNYQKRNLIKRLEHWLYTALMTALIAGIFTLPFIIAHFGYIPVYTIIGNLIILPMFSLVIMPLVMIGTICTLFDIHCILNVTEHIYQFALNIATKIADFPYANLFINNMSNVTLILLIIGLLCIVLIVKFDSENYFKRHINYVIGFMFITMAIIIHNTQIKPLFYSTSDNELVGFIEDGKIKFNKARSAKHSYAFNIWKAFNNEDITDKNTRKKCNKGLCIYKTTNWNLVYMQHLTTIINNINTTCRDKSIDFIVVPFDVKAPNCHAQILRGGMIIYPSGKIIRISGNRPWHKGL